MHKISDEHENPVIAEISRRISVLNAIVSVVILSLFLILIRYSLPSLFPFIQFIPDMSVSFIIASIFILSSAGLYLSHRLSRKVVRIIQDYSNRLERMLNLTKDLREEVYGDILLEKIMDYGLSITDSEAGSILLLDDEKRLVFKIVRGDKADQLIGTSVALGKGITGRVVQEGKPLCVSNVRGSEHFNPELDAMTGFETKSILCVPLKTRDGIIGAIELLNKVGGHPYRQRDEEIVSYLAAQAAISILKTKFVEDQKNYEIHLTDMLMETIDFQQPEKKGHAFRVARYSNVMAKALGMSEEEKKKLYFACLLHDVGFLKIHTEDAYRKDIYMAHPATGYDMIKPITFYSDIAPFILHHHQRYDGYGYPEPQLKGDEIPREARIIAIAEAFDAMISRVSYKVPMNFEAALHELKQKSGSQFDPRLVDLFLEHITPEHTRQ